jgi:hypothetical protein
MYRKNTILADQLWLIDFRFAHFSSDHSTKAELQLGL